MSTDIDLKHTLYSVSKFGAGDSAWYSLGEGRNTEFGRQWVWVHNTEFHFIAHFLPPFLMFQWGGKSIGFNPSYNWTVTWLFNQIIYSSINLVSCIYSYFRLWYKHLAYIKYHLLGWHSFGIIIYFSLLLQRYCQLHAKYIVIA